MGRGPTHWSRWFSGLEIQEVNMRRKAIQISTVASKGHYETLYALCNDGTIWFMESAGQSKWVRTNDLPDDEFFEDDEE